LRRYLATNGQKQPVNSLSHNSNAFHCFRRCQLRGKETPDHASRFRKPLSERLINIMITGKNNIIDNGLKSCIYFEVYKLLITGSSREAALTEKKLSSIWMFHPVFNKLS